MTEFLEGSCPICEHNDIKYGKIEIDLGTGVYANCMCRYCNAVFTEHYDLKYDRPIEVKKGGNYE